MVSNDAKAHQIEELWKQIFSLPFECFINHHWWFISELHAVSWKHHFQYPVFPKQSWKSKEFQSTVNVSLVCSSFADLQANSIIRRFVELQLLPIECVHGCTIQQLFSFIEIAAASFFPSGGKIAEWTQYSDLNPAGIKPIRSLMCQNRVPSRGRAFDYPSGRSVWLFLAHAWPN